MTTSGQTMNVKDKPSSQDLSGHEESAPGRDRNQRQGSLLKRANRPMSPRSRFMVLLMIMVSVCAIIILVMSLVLYRHEMHQQRQMLQVIAQSQARLIESVARYDATTMGALGDADAARKAAAATVSQIIAAHERHERFGETGGFMLARRNGDLIVPLFRHGRGFVETPIPVVLNSGLAEPMRRALDGLPAYDDPDCGFDRNADSTRC